MTLTNDPAAASLLPAMTRLYEDYADTVDNQDLDGWCSYFTEDCRYRVIGRENYDAGLPHATIYCDGLAMVQDRAKATNECTVYEPRYLRHFLSRLRVEKVVDAELHVTCSFMVVESVSDMEPYVHTVGRYVDIVVQTPAGLRFKSRDCVYDNYRIFNSLIFPI